MPRWNGIDDKWQVLAPKGYCPSKPKMETVDSITAIKTQKGINVQGLETWREEFEQETRGEQVD
jgi:hypothetical protein